MQNIKIKKLINGESSVFDRVIVVGVPGIVEAGEKFKLENGYYINENETIFVRSIDTTGKFFKKEKYFQRETGSETSTQG